MSKRSISFALALAVATGHQAAAFGVEHLNAAAVGMLADVSGAESIAAMACSDPSESVSIVAVADTMGVADVEDVAVHIARDCPSVLSGLIGAIAVEAPEKLLPVTLALAHSADEIASIVPAINAFRAGLDDVDFNVGAFWLDIAPEIYAAYGANVATAIAELFRFYGEDANHLYLGFANLTNNSNDPDHRSISLFERVDQMPINLSAYEWEVASPLGGKPPSAN